MYALEMSDPHGDKIYYCIWNRPTYPVLVSCQPLSRCHGIVLYKKPGEANKFRRACRHPYWQQLKTVKLSPNQLKDILFVALS